MKEKKGLRIWKAAERHPMHSWEKSLSHTLTLDNAIFLDSGDPCSEQMYITLFENLRDNWKIVRSLNYIHFDVKHENVVRAIRWAFASSYRWNGIIHIDIDGRIMP